MTARLTPGTVVRREIDGIDWTGVVTVCLCKRHLWQEAVGDGGAGRECGHDRCGYGQPTDDACPWPNHVVWENGLTESHEGAIA